MCEIEKRALEVLRNLNWLIEPHNSYVELMEVKDRAVVIRSIGACTECETDCVGVAFKERMPEIKLIRL